MKIVHIIEDLGCGGAEKVCVELCNYLVEFYPVYLICLYGDDDQARLFWKKNIDNRIKLLFLNKKPGLDKTIFYKLCKELQKIKPEIVNIHLWSLTYASLYLIIYRKAKIIYTIHSINALNDTLRRKYFYWLLFRVRAITLLANSSQVMNFAKRTFGIERCSCINLGINTIAKTKLSISVSEEINSYKNSTNTIVLLNVANLKAIKNHFLLIKAYQQLLSQGYDAVLLIIGEVADAYYYSKLMKIIGKGVHFIGQRDNVSDYFAMSDYFCLTSEAEGLSLATIEAMSMGVIPVVTPSGGIADVVKDGYNGVLSDDHTKESYVNALMRAIELDEKGKQLMRQNAISTYKRNFTMKKCGLKYLELYKSLLRKD
jgi:glycosyltransferase involved in cell wall biosynthesis